MVALPVIPGLSADLRPEPSDQEKREYARAVAARYGIDPASYERQIQQESGFDQRAYNKGSGAAGIAQFMPDTAREEGIDPYDWRAALEAGARYRAKQRDYFKGDERAGLAAYNYGAGNVQNLMRQYGADWEANLPDETKDYLRIVGGGDAQPTTTSQGIGITFAGDASGRSIGGRLRGLQPVSSTPGYLYDARGLEPVSSGDVPFDAGLGGFTPAGREDVPLRSTGTLRSRLRGLDPVDAGSVAVRPHTEDTSSPFKLLSRGFGAVNDVTAPYLEPVRDAAGDLAERGVIGIPGLSQAATLGGLVSDQTGLPNVPGMLNRAGAEGAVPTTLLDTALTLGPGNIAKGFGALRGLTRAAPEAGMLGIIPKNKKQLESAFEQSIRIAKEASDAVLARGGTSQEARQASQAAIRGLQKAEGAVDDVTLAVDRGVESLKYTNTGKRLRNTATELSDRMGNAAVEPKKTGWTITNAAGDAKRVETELPHGYQDAEQAASGGAMRRLERNTADQGALNDSIRGQKAAGSAARSRDAIAAMKGDTDLASRAKTLFGVTTEPRDATFILPDGSMINRTIGAQGDMYAHAGQAAELGATGASDLMERGFVRFLRQGDAVHVELGSAPTPAQIAALKKAAAGASSFSIDAGRGLPEYHARTDWPFTQTRDVHRMIDEATALREAAPAGAILDEAGNVDIAATLADEAARITREGTPPNADLLTGIAAVAKKLGDPGAVLRDKLGGGQEGSAQGKSQTPQPALPGMQPPPPHQGFNPLKELMGVIGGMRTGFASGDMPVMRQGGVLAWGNKKITLDAFKKGVASYVDEAAANAADAAMKADPLYQQAVADGVHFHDFGPTAVNRTANFTGLNDSTFSRLQQQLPWIKGSERATTVFINEQAFQVYKEWTEQMRKGGVTDTKRYEAVADVINHAIGYSGSDAAKKVGALNALFSAEYTFSRFNVLADPFIQMRNGNPEAAKLAGQNLLGLIGGNGSLMTLLALTGESTGRWSVNLNPTSGDFGQLKIGNTRYDTMSGFGPLFKTVARISDAAVANDLLTADGRAKAIVEIAQDISKFFENKEAPAVKAFTEAAWHGKAPDPQELALMYIPGLATGIVEAIIGNWEDPVAAAVNAVGAAIPGFGSVGVNTYSTAEDHADTIAQQTFGGRKYDDLNPTERLQVVAKLPEDAQKKGVQRAREDFNTAAEKAGYILKAPEKETDSEAKVRQRRNADVIKSNPDLDVQRWYFEGQNATEYKEGKGTVHSLDAANKAAALGIANRPVHLAGADRDFAASDDARKALKEKGDLLDQYLNPDKELVAAFAKQPKYKDKKPEEALRSAQGDVRDAIREIPAIDAVLTFFGVGGNSTSKEYLLHSRASLSELQKLWDAYPGAAKFAKEGYGVKFAKDAK